MQPSPGTPGTGTAAASGPLAERARRLGPLPYSSLGMRPSPAGPPEAGDVAAWESSLIDRLWAEAGRPDPFTVVQVAAAEGEVVAEMLGGARRPACSKALRLVLVEADPALRERLAGRLPVESPSLFLGPVTPADDPDEEPAPVTGIGPIATALAELPVVRGWCVVVAVGWLSRFAHDLFEWRDGRWYELRLAAAADAGDRLETIAVELDRDRVSRLDGLIPPERREEGGRYAVRDEAGAWLRSALSAGERGWLVAADHWVARTSPLRGAEVPVALDQLSTIRRPDASTQEGPAGLGVVRWRIG